MYFNVTHFHCDTKLTALAKLAIIHGFMYFSAIQVYKSNTKFSIYTNFPIVKLHLDWDYVKKYFKFRTSDI